MPDDLCCYMETLISILVQINNLLLKSQIRLLMYFLHKADHKIAVMSSNGSDDVKDFQSFNCFQWLRFKERF